MASEAILKFLEDHNRPFSINDILSGAKGDIGKSAVQKALDKLVDGGKVKEKVYGKQKVYCISQNNSTSSTDLRENLLEMDRTINELTLQIKEITDKINSKSKDFSENKGKMSLAECIDADLKLDIDIESLQKELDKYDGVQIICPKKKATIEKQYEKYLGEYKKRKRMCTDILNTILENYPKAKKHLYEDIGIETDEDAGFNLNY